MTARTLLILRHASAANEPGTADADRPLTPIGRKEASEAGRRLAVAKPERVLCSPALRTRQTWQQVSAELASQPKVTFEPGIYEASVDALRELIWQTGDEIGTLLLIGHNPAVHELAWILLGDQAPQHFPPASLAEVTFDGAWTEL
ncbi:histidine phosphatase family protein [Kibdelosporangium philippinense]|uniref:Histidine phosphatase family protein n=1 Tax=Kibdelosporangium philippinense TaxID=211113 RepID=A0ABS8ZH86_9PSEU|nr:histidine phosphatase family protein [Kibdelosporangium philippinense]MCE7005853.1 histidine phosphatase family protein [Kibdelosporangium philippinense]